MDKSEKSPGVGQARAQSGYLRVPGGARAMLGHLSRRLLLIGIALGFSIGLNPGFMTFPGWLVVGAVCVVAAVDTFARSLTARGSALSSWLSWVSFTLYSLYLAFLISRTGAAQSPLILGYPILLINEVAAALSLNEVVVAGGIAFATYLWGIYAGEGGGGFLARQFWVESVLMAGIFINVCWVTRVIAEKNLKLQRSRNALEKFAAGLKTSNEKLERLSYTDGVTGLYNYRYFQVRLREEISRAKRAERSVALIMADLDGFKRFNDTYGHPQGDVLLQRVAAILKDNVREEDAVIRYGGDEFAMILAGADSGTALRIANRVRELIEDLVDEQATRAGVVITLSCGIAVYPVNAESVDELVRKADDALYRVKLTRKNAVQLYSSVMDDLKDELAGMESPALLNTIQTLITVINARDRYTYGHSERVVKYALEIAREIGLSEDEQRVLKYAAFLHDIGKIEISRDILNKRGPLTDDERAIIKQHTLFGVNIIEPIRSLESIIATVLHHHERWDGQGYPGGIAGEEIPVMARILSVADSFDAMMSNRPYRDSLTWRQALDELVACAGTQFDPRVVRAFITACQRPETDLLEVAGVRGKGRAPASDGQLCEGGAGAEGCAG